MRVMAIETRKIPFGPANRNVDPSVLTVESEFLVNFFRDERGGINSRPGWSSNLGSVLPPRGHAQGIYWWEQKQIMIVVGGGEVARVDDQIVDTLACTRLTGDLLAPFKRVSFATDGTRLFMANGGRIVWTDGTTATAYVTDGDAPSFADDIAFIDGYLVSFDRGSNQWYWSDLNDPFTWNALDFASAAGNPDFIVALRIVNREVYLFGSKTLERWENSADSGEFQRIAGGFVEIGCGASESPVATDKGIYFLDNFKHFQVVDGGALKRVSTPYDKEIAKMDVISDCFGDRIEMHGRSFIVFTFPTADRTLAMDLATEEWCELSKWNSVIRRYERWDVYVYGFSPLWNQHLIGKRYEVNGFGQYSLFGSEYLADGDDAIRPAIRSGHVTHGTTKTKRNAEIRICARTGDGISSGTPQLMLRWKDNGRPWSNEFYLSLGDSGETDMVLRKQRCGIYRTRQYEIACSAPIPFVMGDCEEDLEFLR